MLIGANLLVALTILGSAGAYGYVKWRFGQINTKRVDTLTQKDTSGGAPFTLLVVGSDSRAALTQNTGNVDSFGSATQVTGQRSDTIILVRVAPATRQLMIMSIPRDLWVPIPGYGRNRINSAFDSGPALLVKTIQQDLGIPVNHFVEVNFDSFRDISNAVGGIKFYFPTPARDAYSGLNVPRPGCVTLVGDQALAFVRSRHYEYYENGYWHFEALSDLARIQRQQAFVKKMIKKAESEFTNPVALNEVIAGITKNLTVDSGFSTSLMLDLARDFHSVNASAIPTVTLPTYPFTTSGGAEVLGLQQPQAAQAISAFNDFGNAPASSSKQSITKAPARSLPPITVDPSSVSIEVANGSGINSQAADMVTWLNRRGYHAVIVGSPGYGHTTTEILYAPDSRAAAEQVAVSVPGGASLSEDPSLTPTPYNLEIVTGRSLDLKTSSGSDTSQGPLGTSRSTSATTVPGTNPTSYQLPGSSGPTPQTC